MKRIVIFLLSIIAISCNNDDVQNSFDNNDDQNEFDYSVYFSENSIDFDINFMPIETYSNSPTPQSPLLKLKLSSTVEFGCFNYRLGTTQFIIGDELIIRFDEILYPFMCSSAAGPAVSYVDLPHNTNKITFINGNVIDKYDVAIDLERVTVTLIENNFTNSLYDKTFRYPENSFAFVCGTSTNNTNIYEEFLTLLQQNPNFTEFEFEGEGRVPYRETTMGHGVNHPSRYFKYSNPEHFLELANILNVYSDNIEQNSGASIVLYSWNNIKYFSYLEN